MSTDPEDIGTVIAVRTLSLSGEEKVTVTIGKPKRFPEGDDYYCPYRIVGIGNERVRHAGGVDAMQALVLALRMIGAELYTSPEARSGALRWMGRSREGDLGFPVPDGLRDLAP